MKEKDDDNRVDKIIHRNYSAKKNTATARNSYIISSLIRWNILSLSIFSSILYAQSFFHHYSVPFHSLGRNSKVVNSRSHFSLLENANDNSQTEKESTHLSLISEELSTLERNFPFPIDSWQAEAGREILEGRNVIVSAPTGAGKTVVGEMALHIAFQRKMNAIYTTPLKALSNQKFSELRKIFGSEYVGLSTGDVSINRGARITVMTTEVYQNLAGRAKNSIAPISDSENVLASNAFVVLDEFHYMGLPGRGGVWEECVIMSPAHTQIIGLSATIPNAAKLTQWMQSVTSRQSRHVEATCGRPVPLHYMFATKKSLEYIFRNSDAGPGSKLGLLGLRGDGKIDPTETKSDKKKRSKSKGDLPKGLQLNPVLKDQSDLLTQRVNRNIDKVKHQFDRQSFYKGRGRKAVERQERRDRDRMRQNEMRKLIPSYSFILYELNEMDALPAIFFIFSRKGCDGAANTLYQSMRDGLLAGSGSMKEGWKDPISYNNKKSHRQLKKYPFGRSSRTNSSVVTEDLFSIFDEISDIDDISDDFGNKRKSPLEENLESIVENGLLNMKEVEKVITLVSKFNHDNDEIKFDDYDTAKFLYGVGSHHAGHLPAHKTFVEMLFRDQLMKVVFATETLAAGINMPARTTVISTMAKRGDSGMNPLETSNLLQMAGRAGRRGMDTEGTCVIMATAYEGPEKAVSILTSVIKPIVSQFSPSYPLAINLINRGFGKLEVAKNLVEKSFAAWEQNVNVNRTNDTFNEIESNAPTEFLNKLRDAVASLISSGSLGKTRRKQYEKVMNLLNDKLILKKASKQFVGKCQRIKLNNSTEIKEQNNGINMSELYDIDNMIIDFDLDEKIRLVEKLQKEVSKHTLSIMATVCNRLIEGTYPESKELSHILGCCRKNSGILLSLPVTPIELTSFSESCVITKRKKIKKKHKEATNGSNSFISQFDDLFEDSQNNVFDKMLSVINTLEAFGCLKALNKSNSDPELQEYKITVAGENIGLLHFDNSLWVLIAMGGAWDVNWESKLDYTSDMGDSLMNEEVVESSVDNEMETTKLGERESIKDESPKPQIEALSLISLLREMEPNELAGYFSCLVNNRGRDNEPFDIDSFYNLTPLQQKGVQYLLISKERLNDIQMKYSMENNMLSLDLVSCYVVTAWADGCSWDEAIELSGMAPGDLIRILNRVMDGLRQIGSLPYHPVRDIGRDMQHSVGIHPDIIYTCRKAARGMDRYPLKDTLLFQQDENELNEINDEKNIETEISNSTDVIEQETVN